MSRNRRRFTLVEVLVVIAFIGIVVVLSNRVFDNTNGLYYQEGYQAALKGIPVEACPYNRMYSDDIFSGYERQQWVQGWQEGFLVKRHQNSQPLSQTEAEFNFDY